MKLDVMTEKNTTQNARVKRVTTTLPVKKYIPFFVLLLVLASWSALAFVYSPEEIIDVIGVENGYLAAALVAFIGGVSTFAAFPYYLVVFALGVSGLHPVLVGICAGSAVAIGDTLSYVIGHQGKSFITSEKYKKVQKLFVRWAEQRHPAVFSLFLFIYGAGVPIPNDVLMVPLGVMRYPYWKAIIPFMLGNITFNTIVAYLGYRIFLGL